MNLYMFGIIYLFTCLLALSPRSIPSRYFFLFWFSTMILLSLSLRLNFMPDPDTDMATYAMNMAITEYILPYHAREFVFWLGSRFLYQLLADPGWVFFVMDLVLFISFYHGVKLNKAFFKEYINPENIRYLLFGAFLFFPYFHGLENSYRQILEFVPETRFFQKITFRLAPNPKARHPSKSHRLILACCLRFRQMHPLRREPDHVFVAGCGQ